jgi:tetratricopeptide (TPR) repeat protein
LGRVEEALPLHLRAVELNPLSAVSMGGVAWDLRVLGRFAESLAWFEKAIETDPSYRDNYWGLGRHYWQVSGRRDEAVVWYMKAISLFPGEPIPLGPGEPDYLAELGKIFMQLGDFARAEYWYEKSAELDAERFAPRNGMMFLHLYRGNETAMVDHARRLLAEFPTYQSPLMLLRNHEIKAGRYDEARNLYEKTHPELLRDDPEVERMNYGEALDLALVLLKTGETELADLLLKRSLQYIQTQPRQDLAGYKMMTAQIFALQGKKQKALSALRQAYYETYPGNWQYAFKHEPNLESLRGEPEFKAIREEIRADMAAQLARVREMERSGELAAIPRSEANLH